MGSIAKKKLKGDGIFFIGENSTDVTGSQILIRFNGKQILLECGLYQNNSYLESYKINSKKFKFVPSEIDYCFIAHPHADHSSLVPRLVKEGFKGKVIMSHETAVISKALMLNCAYILESEARMLSKKYKRDYSPIYIRDDVLHALDFFYEYNECHKIYNLDDVVSFQWLENSHCVGARQLQLILTDELGVNTSILYTSDIGALNSKNHYVNNAEIPDMFNRYTIMESTYGERQRINKKTREFDLEHIRVAINTVLERNGTVVFPAFSYSRTQELLTNIYNLYHKGKTFTYDVIVDSKLSCEISELYNEVLDGDNLKQWNKVFNWENVKFIKEKDESIACVKNKSPKIVISSSGFCTNGRILSYLEEYLKDTNSMVVFSGYVGNDNSYLSYRIKNYKDHKTININKKPIPNRADCITLSSFSSHASREDLIKWGSEVQTEKLILIHGSEKAKLELKEDLEKAISKNNKSFKVICSSKDMVLHF